MKTVPLRFFLPVIILFSTTAFSSQKEPETQKKIESKTQKVIAAAVAIVAYSALIIVATTSVQRALAEREKNRQCDADVQAERDKTEQIRKQCDADVQAERDKTEQIRKQYSPENNQSPHTPNDANNPHPQPKEPKPIGIAASINFDD